jgi:hypothetical protein
LLWACGEAENNGSKSLGGAKLLTPWQPGSRERMRERERERKEEIDHQIGGTTN